LLSKFNLCRYNPEYPTGFVGGEAHSGSRSINADRPLPV
jgi:hypothetical protein